MKTKFSRFLLISGLILISACTENQNNPEKSTDTFTDFKKPAGVSFDVDEVEMADSLLKTDSAITIFENKIGKTILFMPEEQTNFDLVYAPNNGLIQTLQECYDNHRPLILTPDVIWLAICQGVSIHINEHYDSLKNSLFNENKPDEIVIRNDSLEYGGKHWKNLISSFSDETKKYTRDDFYSFFVSDFSTTTPIEKTAYQVTLLESYKKAFKYVGVTGCGIPSILIAGKTADWQIILSKLDMLDKIGLSDWAQTLRPVIKEFISASDGKERKEFWQSIYKSASDYNGIYISGWIIKFFPYVKDLESEGVFNELTDETKIEERYIPNKFLLDDNYLLSTLATDNFPSGIAKIPLTWINIYKDFTKELEVLAGFFAIKQYPDKSLEPLISWAVCEKNATTPGIKPIENKNLTLNHKPDDWAPFFASDVKDSAIYDRKQFQNQKSSVNYLRQVLLDSLQNNPLFTSSDYMNDTVKAEILSNGKIGKISLMHSANQKLAFRISKIIKGLPGEWFPALARPADVLDLMDIPEGMENYKIRANSIVKIGL